MAISLTLFFYILSLYDSKKNKYYGIMYSIWMRTFFFFYDKP